MVICKHLNCGNIVSVSLKDTTTEIRKSARKIECKGNDMTLEACDVSENKCNNYVYTVIKCSGKVILHS